MATANMGNMISQPVIGQTWVSAARNTPAIAAKPLPMNHVISFTLSIWIPEANASSGLLDVALIALPILVFTKIKCIISARAIAVKISHNQRLIILSGPTSNEDQVVLKYKGFQLQSAPIEYLSIKPKAIEATIR